MLAIAKALGVGTGTVQRIAREMEAARPFDGVSAAAARRCWTASEKVRMVEETFAPRMMVSLVARRHGVAPNQLFTWRRWRRVARAAETPVRESTCSTVRWLRLMLELSR